MRNTSSPLSVLVLSCGIAAVGCSGSGAAVISPGDTGGVNSVGGSSAGNLGGASSGGQAPSSGGTTVASQSTGGTTSVGATTTPGGGIPATGGKSSTDVTVPTGGTKASGGSVSSGGSVATGGTKATTGGAATGGFGFTTGGAATGGTKATTGGAATGGAATGGFGFTTGGAATGGTKATGGAAPGGSSATGGASTVSTSTAPALDCTNIPAMPTGGTQHTGSTQGGTGDLAWNLWMNGSGGSLTTFSTPAFSASWGPNSGDYLARLGAEWGSNSKAYTAYGTITAQFAYTKTGTGGGYSYIGIYGWSTNPCIEWYIVDDSYNGMPVNPGNTQNKGTLSVDDGTYTLYVRPTTGTGGNRCGNVSSWNQYYSVRQKARQCGTISISKHFDAWAAASMPLGNMLEAKILVEVGGGTGTINFPIANVTTTN